MYKVGIITASDKGSRGEREDLSAQVIREEAAKIGGKVLEYAIVPDEQELIQNKLIEFA
ncbi:MAG: MogA/MoaB family molybdenum cofactor biosynthesis protein, partial [Eubacteriales bacterium]